MATGNNNGGGIDFGRHFGNNSNSNNNSNSAADRVPSEFWLNIGYSTTIEGENGPEQRFVALPQGLALDSMEHVALRGSQDFIDFSTAKNDLLDDVMAAASKLGHGEECTLNLQIQLRRTKAPAAPTSTSENRFARPTSLLVEATKPETANAE